MGNHPRLDNLTRFQSILLATDDWWCTAITGELDMTLSTYAGMHKDRLPWGALYWVLDHIAEKHCERARAHDYIRAEKAAALLELRKRGPIL